MLTVIKISLVWPQSSTAKCNEYMQVFFKRGKPVKNWLLTPFPLPVNEFAFVFFF